MATLMARPQMQGPGPMPQEQVQDFSSLMTSASSLPVLGMDPDGKNRTQVFLKLSVSRIWGINQKQQNFKIKFSTQWAWRDCRMLFASTTEGLDVILGNMNPYWDSFWKMSMLVEEQEDHIEIGNDVERMWFAPDGLVVHSKNHLHTVACKFNFEEMPYDQQTCRISITNPFYHNGNLQLRWQPAGDHSHPDGALEHTVTLSNSEWEIPGVTEWVIGNSTRRVWLAGKKLYLSELYAEFTIRRKSYYLLTSYVIPTVIFWLMSYAGLWVDPAAVPGRLSMGLIPVLMLINKHNALKAALPPIAQGTRLENFMTFTLIMAALMLVEYCIVNYVQVQMRSMAARKAEDEAIGKRPSKADRCYHRSVLFVHRWLEFHARWLFVLAWGTGAVFFIGVE